MAKSGFEALIEALKQSGADMGGFGGARAAGAGGADGSSDGAAGGAGASRPGAGKP